MSAPAVAIRFFLAASAVVAMLVLAGCGSGDEAAPAREETALAQQDATAPEGPASPAPEGPAKPPARVSCRAQLGEFLGSLNRLRVRLAAGLSYPQYAKAVKGIRAAYDELPVDRLPPDCLVAAGTASEKAFNRYIEAANAWGECLADAGCNSEVVEPELQRQWQVASHWLSAAHAGLRG